MKSKIALILCIVMIISCLASCQKAPEITDDSIIDSSAPQSETISQETSGDSSEADETPAIPEKVAYFKGQYDYYSWSPGIVGNERYSSEIVGQSITHLLLEHGPSLDKTNVYYYIGFNFFTGSEEKIKNKDEIFEAVGFIPTDDKYLHIDYHDEVLNTLYLDFSDEEVRKEYEDIFREHAQNLAPDADLSKYKEFTRLHVLCYHFTGYITLDGLEKLQNDYGKIEFTWLPAPDDRERLLNDLARS